MAISLSWVEVNPANITEEISEIPYLDLGAFVPGANNDSSSLSVHAFKLRVWGSAISGAPAPNPASNTLDAISLYLTSSKANVYSYNTLLNNEPKITIQQEIGSTGLGLNVYASVLPEALWATGDFTNWVDLTTTVLNVSTYDGGSNVIPIDVNTRLIAETPPIGIAVKVPSDFSTSFPGGYDIRNLRLRINFITVDI